MIIERRVQYVNYGIYYYIIIIIIGGGLDSIFNCAWGMN